MSTINDGQINELQQKKRVLSLIKVR